MVFRILENSFFLIDEKNKIGQETWSRNFDSLLLLEEVRESFRLRKHVDRCRRLIGLKES